MKKYKLSEIETIVKQGKINEASIVVESDEIFEPEKRRRKDSYVYIFLDPRVTLKSYEVTEDFSVTNPIIYIGRGTAARVVNHISYNQGSSKPTNLHLTRWIDIMRAKDVEPLVIIYTNNLSKAQSEDLEADLLSVTFRLQDPISGNDIYTASTHPLKLFNKRKERSECLCYDVDGKRAVI